LAALRAAEASTGRLRPRGAPAAGRLRKAALSSPGTACPTLASAAGLLLLTGYRRGTCPDRNDLKVAVRDRILVLLPKETLLHEYVDARRKVSRPHLPLIQVDRARVLLAPENELRLFLPLHLMAPDRHRHRHEERHDSDTHQQCSHRIPALAALTL
jgi:hypothetical protein